MTAMAGDPARYRVLKEGDLPVYLSGIPEAAATLGGAPPGWRVREVGDGNLNLVFIAEGPKGGVVVKQALPYLRLVGESWPLPRERAFFESEALKAEYAAAPRRVPKLFRFDADLSCTVMEYLSPHIILRKGFAAGTLYPDLASHMAEFMAETLFRTSDLHLTAAAKKAGMALFCANTELCKITEDLVFTDPWRVAEQNRWTTPQLDGIARATREDAPFKRAVQQLKLKFLSEAQALIHGDLHSGSIMVTPQDSRVIDPEFAFYGPMGFDTGALIGNWLLAYCAQPGHERRPGERREYGNWILDQVVAVWTEFDERFRALWDRHGTGDAFVAGLFVDAEGRKALRAAQDAYMRQLFLDTLGFGACKMTRRILGLAHVSELETIEDPDVRAACETRALKLARRLAVEADTFPDIAAVVAAARATK